jgi:thioredoxin 1
LTRRSPPHRSRCSSSSGRNGATPCRLIAPILDSIAAEYADRLRVCKVNSDDRPELALRYDVMSVPTILVFHHGELRRRMVGARSRSRLLDELAGVLNP